MELTSSSSIQTYKEITKVRDFLKQIQQISWDMSAIEKRYPIDKVDETMLDDILAIYQDLIERVIRIGQEAQ